MLAAALETGLVRDKRTAGTSGTWRPWTVWVPFALAFAWSALLLAGLEIGRARIPRLAGSGLCAWFG